MGLIRKEDLNESLLNSLSNQNLLINGDFQVWQRGENFSYGSGNNVNMFTADRWRLIQSSGVATARVYKSSEIEENTLTITEFNKPSGMEMGLTQKLDYPLQKGDGKRYTLSLLYSSTLNAELIIREYDNDNTLGRKKMPASASISRVLITFDSSKLSKKNNRIEIYINFGSEQTYDNSQINLSNIKLEVGSVATSFSPRLYSEELALCQRYYEHSTMVTRGLIGSELTRLSFDVKYKKTKRIVPTLKIYGLNSEEGTVAGKIGSSMNFPIQVYQNCVDGFGCIDIVDNKGQSFVSGESFEMHGWISDAEIY